MTANGYLDDLWMKAKANSDSAGTYQAYIYWFLMTSYAYYILDESLLKDSTFDGLCKELLAAHEAGAACHHSGLITKEMLEAGSGHNLKHEDYPQGIVRMAYKLVDMQQDRMK